MNNIKLQPYSVADAKLERGMRNDDVAMYISARLPNEGGEVAQATVRLFPANLTTGKFLTEILSTLTSEKEAVEPSNAGSTAVAVAVELLIFQ